VETLSPFVKKVKRKDKIHYYWCESYRDKKSKYPKQRILEPLTEQEIKDYLESKTIIKTISSENVVKQEPLLQSIGIPATKKNKNSMLYLDAIIKSIEKDFNNEVFKDNKETKELLNEYELPQELINVITQNFKSPSKHYRTIIFRLLETYKK